LQPGGHRFDPGQLHQDFAVGEDFMDSLLELVGGIAEVFAEPLAGLLVSVGRSIGGAASQDDLAGSIFGKSPWWRS
jgi:hypothetical protein